MGDHSLLRGWEGVQTFVLIEASSFTIQPTSSYLSLPIYNAGWIIPLNTTIIAYRKQTVTIFLINVSCLVAISTHGHVPIEAQNALKIVRLLCVISLNYFTTIVRYRSSMCNNVCLIEETIKRLPTLNMTPLSDIFTY